MITLPTSGGVALNITTPDDLPKDSDMLQGVQVQSPAPPTPPTPTNPQADPRFLDPLVLEYINGREWKVVHEFVYRTDIYRINPIHVQAGFITDFASVPKLLWNVMPPTGMYGKAAVVHDYLYRTLGIATRGEADNVFLEAMAALGVSKFIRLTMFWGVRVFGGRAYKGGL